MKAVVMERYGTPEVLELRDVAPPRPIESSGSERFMARKTQRPKRTLVAGLPERSEDGVDVTLIRWMLSLTPAERLRAAQDLANSLARLRAGRIQS